MADKNFDTGIEAREIESRAGSVNDNGSVQAYDTDLKAL
jgi:hypothetical protein